MIALFLSVFFTAAIYVIMRAFSRFGVSPFHAVVFNYYSCVATGIVLIPDAGQFRSLRPDMVSTELSFALGAMFVVVFLLIGLTTDKAGITAASLAGNMSLVIPVCFGLFVFRNVNKDFTAFNYAGLILALVALALGAIRKDEEGRGGDFVWHRRNMVWLFPLMSFLASGVNNTLINYITMSYYKPDESILFMVTACLGAIVAGTCMILFRFLMYTEKVSWKSVVWGLILGVPNFLSLYFLLEALAEFSHSAAFVFPVYNILCMLFSAWIAWLIYKERLSRINRLGLFLALVAIVLISHQELGL